MSRTADIASRFAPALLVTALGLVMCWPIPLGRMPLSADHTVHLTRIWLFADTLADGSLRSWSPVWFFGTPIGELYPVLGDLLVIAVRVVSFGLLDWPRAYAVGFTIVFVAQGWVMLRAGRTMGLGPWPGLVAAALVLLDLGWYREGGFVYTVWYGVWPQTLATSLTWLGLAELAAAIDIENATQRRRRIAYAALAMGGALLAHQMSMLVLAIAGPIVVLTVGLGSKARLRRATVTGLLVAALALGLAAWWLLPMLAHRGWMASYGWLHRPLDQMLELALQGRWCLSMPPAVGWVAIAGLAIVAAVGSRPARAFAATALVLWVVASIDVVWRLRLDLVSDGFAHLQYQRFITAAKPGLFLVAGVAVGGLVARAARWRNGRAIAAAAGVVAIALTAWMSVGLRDEWRNSEMPPAMREVQLQRDLPGLDEDHAALTAFLAQQWTECDRFWRVSVRDQRNIHWFMDIPALADGVPLLKQGFTPGDNFVHKPEKAPPQLQALAQVRYEVRRGSRDSRGLAQRFGQVAVYERDAWDQDGVATMRGSGRVEVIEDTGEHVRVRVSDAGADAMLVFGIAGFPRWRLHGPDGDVEWIEVPVVGDGPSATQQQRRSNELRGGKAHGDDGTEPTLVAANVHDGEYTLSYARWQARDLVALLLSLLTAAACGALLWRPRSFARPELALDTVDRRLAIIGHPFVWAAVVLGVVLFAAVRVQRGRAAEASRAYGWAIDERAELRSAKVAFHKTDMLIRPAVVFDRRARDSAIASFRSVALGDTLEGWVALDDDDAKDQRRGTQRLAIEARVAGSGAWTSILDRPVPHVPGRTLLSLPLGELAGSVADVRVVLRSEGQRPPLVAFDLELGEPRD